MSDLRNAHETALSRALQAFTDPTTAHTIVYGPGPVPEQDADWVPNTMQRLEQTFEPGVVQRIRMQCQCGYAMDEKRALVQHLFDQANTLDAFANCQDARQAGLFAENGELFLQFRYCPCPMVAQVDRLPTKTWCLCTLGYSQVLFEAVFGCNVHVELLKTIKCGDPICLMKIVPQADLWPRLPGNTCAHTR